MCSVKSNIYSLSALGTKELKDYARKCCSGALQEIFFSIRFPVSWHTGIFNIEQRIKLLFEGLFRFDFLRKSHFTCISMHSCNQTASIFCTSIIFKTYYLLTLLAKIYFKICVIRKFISNHYIFTSVITDIFY